MHIEPGSEATRILLVEDDADDVFLLTHALSRRLERAKVQVTRNGREALDYLSAFASIDEPGCPSLVILDLNMPFLDGHGLLMAIRRDEELRGLPVIVMTGVENHDSVRRAYHDGASAVVRKPRTMDEMGEIIDSIIDFWFNTAQPPRGDVVQV
ncbi:MAG: response regulator [Pseudomonadota bacterium]